jgi:FAD:protein FMN transferase
MQLKFEGIGTHWKIDIFSDLNESQKLEFESLVRLVVSDFEAKYSRFNPKSLIGILNDTNQLVSPPNELLEMLKYAEEVRILTKGAFNIGVGRALENSGYDKNYSFVDKPLDFKIAEESFKTISNERIILNEGVRLDLGGLGKGWLIDKVAKIFFENNIEYFCINAGGDIFATSNKGHPVKFKIENPFDINQFIGEIRVFNGAVAASSNNRRSWVGKTSGKIFHHLVKSESGLKNNVVGVFTEGKDALSADVAATALFVSSPDLHQSISDYFKIQFLVVFKDGSYFATRDYSGKLLK